MEKPKILLEDICLLEDPAAFDAAMACVPPSRREKALRFRSEKDRRLSLHAGFLLVKALVRDGTLQDLSEGSGLRILTTEKGKPRLPDYPEVHFSLSHAGTKVLCVTGDREVGCDLEQTARAELRVAKRFFSPEEWERIEASPEPKETFTRLWTLKESYLKVIGEGLLRPMNTFTVVPEDPPYVREDPACIMGFIEAGEDYRASWAMLDR